VSKQLAEWFRWTMRYGWCWAVVERAAGTGADSEGGGADEKVGSSGCGQFARHARVESVCGAGDL
jgi:hypothetical protein